MRLKWILILVLLISSIFAQQKIELSRPLEVEGEVDISVISGKITIQTWDKNQVLIQGSIGKDVEELEVKGSRNRIRIEPYITQKGGDIDADVNLMISIPEHAELDINTVSAPVSVSGLMGDECEIETVSGSISVEGDIGDCELRSVSGKVFFEGSAKSISAKSVSGDVSVEGRFKELGASSVSGDVHIKNVKASEIKLTSTSGDIFYYGGLGDNVEFKASSVSGKIKVNFEDDVEGEFKLSTLSGKIKNLLTDDKPVKENDEPGTEMHFTRGHKQNEIRISTISGYIELK